MTVDLTRQTNLVGWTRQGIDIEIAMQAMAVAQASAAAAAGSAQAAADAAASVRSTNDLGATALAFVMCPGGVTPDRPSPRLDVAYVWFSPSPPSTAAGKLIPGLDFWCVMDV